MAQGGENWGGLGLRGLSSTMAVFSGFVAVVLAIALTVLVASAVSGGRGQPVHWKLGTGVNTPDETTIFQMRETRTCPARHNGICPEVGGEVRSPNGAPLALHLAMGLGPLAVLIYGLSQACLCFAGMARGHFLHGRSASRLIRFALAGLVFLIATPFTAATYSGVFELLTAIYAGTLTIIALIMVKASRIADDHAQII